VLAQKSISNDTCNPMIYDCFLFSDELEILELRLAELDEVVDHFVLVESKSTFSGIPKNLFFEENKHRFKRYLNKIRHVIVEDSPEKQESAWDVEAHQRNAILRGLNDSQSNDLIIISDVDEIPRQEVIADFTGDLAVAELEEFYYKLNCKDLAAKVAAPLLIRRGLLDVPQEARFRARRFWKYNIETIHDGGWHFSCVADPIRLKNKLQSFSHQEFNTPEFTDPDAITYKIKYGLDLVDRRARYWCCVPLDETFPAYLRSHRARFSHLLFEFDDFHKNRLDLIYSLQEQHRSDRKTIDELKRNEEKLLQEGTELRIQLQGMLGSRSWRATRPLRTVTEKARQILKHTKRRNGALGPYP
jgi:beta-1,4-mannosyl-glycoprotein beta-1,4-N-acetylglucosaminyltransferase